jgi:hypothetical protein
LVRTGYPTAQFRNANEGVPRSKSSFENRLVECFIIDSQVAADKALADVWEPGGAAAYQMIEGAGVLEASAPSGGEVDLLRQLSSCGCGWSG